jgi:hypothetical protein
MTYMHKPIQVTLILKRSDLPFAEQLLLWGIRMWAYAFNQGENNYETINKGFCLAGANGAHEALDSIMSVFATSGLGIMNINCPKCEYISIDEHRIMGAVAAWQNEIDPLIGNAYISSWLPPAALRIICLPAHQLAKTLKQGNLNISLRPWVNDFIPENKTIPSSHNQNRYLH